MVKRESTMERNNVLAIDLMGKWNKKAHDYDSADAVATPGHGAIAKESVCPPKWAGNVIPDQERHRAAPVAGKESIAMGFVTSQVRNR